MDEKGYVVFKMGTRAQAVTIGDANQILDHFVENSAAFWELHPQVRRAVREGGGEVRVRNERRDELRQVLDAIEGQGRPLTERLSALREALREPIVPDHDSGDERERR